MPSRKCPSGKRRHEDEMAAIAAALRRSRSGTPLRVYPCPTCGGYHLTKMRKW